MPNDARPCAGRSGTGGTPSMATSSSGGGGEACAETTSLAKREGAGAASPPPPPPPPRRRRGPPLRADAGVAHAGAARRGLGGEYLALDGLEVDEHHGDLLEGVVGEGSVVEGLDELGDEARKVEEGFLHHAHVGGVRDARQIVLLHGVGDAGQDADQLGGVGPGGFQGFEQHLRARNPDVLGGLVGGKRRGREDLGRSAVCRGARLERVGRVGPRNGKSPGQVGMG